MQPKATLNEIQRRVQRCKVGYPCFKKGRLPCHKQRQPRTGCKLYSGQANPDMNGIARQVFGVSIFSFKARDTVIVHPPNGDCSTWAMVVGATRYHTVDSVRQTSLLRRSIPRKEMQRRMRFLDIYDPCIDDDDDETASTMSTADESSCCSDCSDGGFRRQRLTKTVVSFDTPLVTAVYIRPFTTLQEKRVLYYSDIEYREFRRDYFYRPRDRQVQFSPNLVTKVHSIPLAEDPSDLYYSEADLQGYVSRDSRTKRSLC
jgi:hypothetical protein